MGKEKDDKDLRTRDFVKEMEAYARQNGYSRDTALDQLIYVMTAFFNFGKTDGQLESIVLMHYNELFRLMRVFFFTLRNELEGHEWYDPLATTLWRWLPTLKASDSVSRPTVCVT